MFLAGILNKNISFSIITSIIISLLIADMLIAKTYIFTTSQAFSSWRLTALVVIAALFVVGQYLLLEIIKKRIKEVRASREFGLKTIHTVVTATQYVIAAIIIALIFQVILTSQYYTMEIVTCVTISYALSITLLAVLAIRFFRWYMVNRNIVVLLYFISSLIIATNAALTLTFVDTILMQQPTKARPHSGTVYPTEFLSSITIMGIVNYGFIVSSVAAFLSFWFATSLLLRHYSEKLGIVKYWILLSIPLIYFLLQFLPSFMNLFSIAIKSNPVLFSIIYTIIFTLTKPVGGILFGIAFWSIARSLPIKSTVRRYFIISSFGIILLFTSNQAVIFASFNYPAFGVVTVSVMGLASYLLFLGIYSSAISVAEDSELRKSIRRYATNESRLLDSIGIAQMEGEIEKIVLTFAKRNQLEMAEETGIQSSLSEDDIKKYLGQVLQEVRKQKTPRN